MKGGGLSTLEASFVLEFTKENKRIGAYALISRQKEKKWSDHKTFPFSMFAKFFK